jgi:hypothetical protein
VESIAASGSEDDPPPNPQALTPVVLMMMGMPYLLLGTTGLLIYWSFKKMARAGESAAGGPGAPGKEGPSCPLPSRDEIS